MIQKFKNCTINFYNKTIILNFIKYFTAQNNIKIFNKITLVDNFNDRIVGIK